GSRAIDHHQLIADVLAAGTVVRDLGLGRDVGDRRAGIDVGGVDVGARRAQAAIERKRLVDLVGNVYIGVLPDATVARVERRRVALEALPGGHFRVAEAIV